MFGRTTHYAMSRDEAQAQIDLYAELPELTEHERRMLDVYDAIVKGDKFIDLLSVLVDAGASDPWEYPRLALAPVIASSVTYERVLKKRGQVSLFEYRTQSWTLKLPTRDYEGYNRRSFEATALAPSIPPQHREKVIETDLLIWEPTWRVQNERVSSARVPDPAIIRQTNNSIYRVIAAWDLSPVEAKLLAE